MQDQPKNKRESSSNPWLPEYIMLSLFFGLIAIAVLFFKQKITSNSFIGLSTVLILFATLLAIVLYTYYTKKQTEASIKQTEATIDDIKVRQNPLLSSIIEIGQEYHPDRTTKEIHINPLIFNQTGNHAFCYVVLKVIIWDEEFETKDKYYNGTNIWNIFSGTPFRGHILLSEFINQKTYDWYIDRLNSYIKSNDPKGHDEIKGQIDQIINGNSNFPINLILKSTFGIKITIELFYFRWDLKYEASKIQLALQEWPEDDKYNWIVNPPQRYYLQLKNDMRIIRIPMTSHRG